MAHISAIAGSEAPEGRGRWTYQLIATSWSSAMDEISKAPDQESDAFSAFETEKFLLWL